MSALERQVGGTHYKGAIQPVEFILANGIPFIEGTIIKYLYRWRDKGGIEDLEKAKHYIQILIEAESRRESRDANSVYGDKEQEERMEAAD